MTSKSYECEPCGKSYKGVSGFKRHQKTHSMQKLYRCLICEKKFVTNGELKSHFMIHSTIKEQFKCNVCDRKFISLRYLKLHKRIHDDAKHKCDICEKKFDTNAELKSHIMIHSTIKKEYECSI